MQITFKFLSEMESRIRGKEKEGMIINFLSYNFDDGE